MVEKKDGKARRKSRPVPRVPADDRPVRVDLPLVCEACKMLGRQH